MKSMIPQYEWILGWQCTYYMYMYPFRSMCRFTLGYCGVPLGIGLFAVATRFLGNGFHSWWSGSQSSVKTLQSSHLLILSGWMPILTTTMQRKPWKTSKNICFAVNYHVYPGNLLETWETIGNPTVTGSVGIVFLKWSNPIPSNTHLAHRLPSIVRPSLAPCRPGNGGHDEHQEQSLLHWEHNIGVTIGFVHML